MEFQTIFKEDSPLPLSNHHLQPDPKTEDDFPIQDLHRLHKCSQMVPSFHHDYGTNVYGYDPFDPFSHGLASDYLRFKPFEPENSCEMMMNYVGRGSLTHMGKTLTDHVSGFDRFVNVDVPIHDFKPSNFLIPDEGPSVTNENGFMKSSGNSYKGKRKTNSSKGQWTKEEDRVLKHLVEKHGCRKWSYIAQMLKGRIGKQCRERWHNHLKPNIKVPEFALHHKLLEVDTIDSLLDEIPPVNCGGNGEKTRLDLMEIISQVNL
ncbi:hypothetical protein L2E82_27323 [Cichorium intybus]|uniref:Uncharacterized protein n=1 Tax=Cichorium intybus TaxID=13427 RepID=A0ACB9CSS9_CICIN|nr:hypothetical protein L2E82_27323 [Cichorium intybus]